MTHAVVVGPTGWGTTLGVLLARNGVAVTLLCRDGDEAASLNAARENTRRRPGLLFPEALTATAEPSCLDDADLVVIAVPSATLRANLEGIASRIPAAAGVLSATKGIEPETGLRMSEIIAEAGIEPERILALSGPNFAEEIARGLPAATVVAGSDASRAELVQRLLNGPTFRVYTSSDVAGVELGGALKNVVAIACGISDGLGFGDNARAALITRSLAEIARLGVAAGALALTFQGLAGLGDLVLSCGSDLSRNRRLGLALGRGLSLEQARAEVGGLVEGVVTGRAAPLLARRCGVEMPICTALYAVLYEGKTPQEAVRELMARTAKPEIDGTLAV